MLNSRLIFAAAGVLTLAFTFLNCSDDPAETTGATGPATTAATGGMGGGGGAGGAMGGMGGTGGVPCELCTCLSNDGGEIEMMAVDQDAPAPAGGIIRDGWYELTNVTAYTGPGGNTGATGRSFKIGAYFFGPNAEMVIDQLDGSDELLVAMAAQPGDNGAIDFTVACPIDMPPYIPYQTYAFIDGDPAKLVLYASGNADTAFEFTMTMAAGADDGTAGNP